MRNASSIQISRNNGMYPLDRYTPIGWSEEYVVYAQVGLKIVNKTVEFVISKGPYAHKGKNLLVALREIGKGQPDTGNDPWPDTSPGYKQLRPLDLDIRRPSMVIIELDGSTNWQFRTDGPAVSTKDPISDANAKLRHVTFSTDGAYTPQLDFNPPSANGCRVVCFAVVQRDMHDMQGINLHVEFTQGAQAIGVIIDPDVGNNGGTIYPPAIAIDS